jgi:G8 domain
MLHSFYVQVFSVNSNGLGGATRAREALLRSLVVLLCVGATAVHAQCPFNVAGNATASAANDGLLLTRAAQLVRGSELLAKTNTAVTADALVANLATNEAKLDVNASGAFDETDAAIIVRHLFGFRNDALIPGGAGQGATRKTANDIQSYIDGGCIAPAPTRKKLSQMPRSNGGVLISILDDVEIDQDATLEWLEIQGSLVCTDRDLNLSSKWIIVHGGVFRCGTELNPFNKRVVVTLTGEESNENALGVGMGTKVFGVMHGGALHLHGLSKTSWTQLNGTANVGATTINVLNASGWNVGDQIAIAPTDFEPLQDEKRTITAINGNTISFTQPLRYQHWGAIQTLGATGDTLDQRAEVANLSRNIVIRGAAESTGAFGGHMMFMANSKTRLSSIEVTGMGQQGRVGRYPVHWHIVGDGGRGSYLKSAAVHSNLQRGVVVHRTNDLRIENNVIYDTFGHMVFIESSNEVRNSFERNVAMKSKPIPPARRNAEIEFEHTSVDGFGSMVAGFWISNLNNRFVDNRVVGLQNGIGYWFSDGTFSLRRDLDFCVDQIQYNLQWCQLGTTSAYNTLRTAPVKLVFDGNWAHSMRSDAQYGEGGFNHPAGTGVFLEKLAFGAGDAGDIPTIRNFRAWKLAGSGVWAPNTSVPYYFDSFPAEKRTPVVTGMIAADVRSALFASMFFAPLTVENSTLYGFTNNQTIGPNQAKTSAQEFDWIPIWQRFGNSNDDLNITALAAYPTIFNTSNNLTATEVYGALQNSGRNTERRYIRYDNVRLGGWPK